MNPSQLYDIDAFRGVPESELRLLLENVEIRTYESGSPLFLQGDKGGFALLLVEGRCFAWAGRTPESTPLGDVKKGELVGETGLLLDGVPRNATLIASQSVSALVLTPNTMESISGTLLRTKLDQVVLQNLARRLRSSNGALRRGWVRQRVDVDDAIDVSAAKSNNRVSGGASRPLSPLHSQAPALNVDHADLARRLLRSLRRPPSDAPALAQVLRRAEAVREPNGTTLIDYDNPPGGLILVLSGRVSVMVPDGGNGGPNSRLREVARLDSPAILGEVAAIDDGPRSAGCVMASAGLVLRLSRNAVLSALDEVSVPGETFRLLLAINLVRQLSNTNRQLREIWS